MKYSCVCLRCNSSPVIFGKRSIHRYILSKPHSQCPVCGEANPSVVCIPETLNDLLDLRLQEKKEKKNHECNISSTQRGTAENH